MFQYSPMLGRSSFWDMKCIFFRIGTPRTVIFCYKTLQLFPTSENARLNSLHHLRIWIQCFFGVLKVKKKQNKTKNKSLQTLKPCIKAMIYNRETMSKESSRLIKCCILHHDVNYSCNYYSKYIKIIQQRAYYWIRWLIKGFQFIYIKMFQGKYSIKQF